jgi:hypothetical protein
MIFLVDPQNPMRQKCPSKCADYCLKCDDKCFPGGVYYPLYGIEPPIEI